MVFRWKRFRRWCINGIFDDISNTKIHAVVNQDGIPLRILLTKGNIRAIKMDLKVTILADKGYDTDWLRDKLNNPV